MVSFVDQREGSHRNEVDWFRPTQTQTQNISLLIKPRPCFAGRSLIKNERVKLHRKQQSHVIFTTDHVERSLRLFTTIGIRMSMFTIKSSSFGLLQHHFPVSVVTTFRQGLVEEGEVEIGSIRQEQRVNVILGSRKPAGQLSG